MSAKKKPKPSKQLEDAICKAINLQYACLLSPAELRRFKEISKKPAPSEADVIWAEAILAKQQTLEAEAKAAKAEWDRLAELEGIR